MAHSSDEHISSGGGVRGRGGDLCYRSKTVFIYVVLQQNGDFWGGIFETKNAFSVFTSSTKKAVNKLRKSELWDLNFNFRFVNKMI